MNKTRFRPAYLKCKERVCRIENRAGRTRFADGGANEKPKILARTSASVWSIERKEQKRNLEVARTGLTFDDVLLVPKYSTIRSRKDASTKTRLTEKIELNIPIISANMDTVTEANMAVAMAREGGIGIIHRFMSVEEEVAQVSRVKRTESIFIENPYTLNESATISEVRHDSGAEGRRYFDRGRDRKNKGNRYF